MTLALSRQGVGVHRTSKSPPHGWGERLVQAQVTACRGLEAVSVVENQAGAGGPLDEKETPSLQPRRWWVEEELSAEKAPRVSPSQEFHMLMELFQPKELKYSFGAWSAAWSIRRLKANETHRP